MYKGVFILKLKDLITPPTMYRNRLKDSYNIYPTINSSSNHITNFLIKYNCGNYTVEFQFIGETLKIDNNLKIYCSCPSFNFEFAHILNDDESLLYPESFKKAINSTPTKKNKHNLIGGCKHCIACGRLTFNKFDLLQTRLRR